MATKGTVKDEAEHVAASTQETSAAAQVDAVSESTATQDDVIAGAELAMARDTIARLEKELGETQARANAEIYNFQKRVERETDNVKKYALEKFAGGLLEVVDNLERALATPVNDDNKVLLDGVSLTLKGMLTAMEKHGVHVVNPDNETFNAELHQAVGIDATAEKGVVGKVLQKGYTLAGRLLRPAMVMVGE